MIAASDDALLGYTLVRAAADCRRHGFVTVLKPRMSFASAPAVVDDAAPLIEATPPL